MFREAISLICLFIGLSVLALASIDYIIEQRGGDLIKDDGIVEEYLEDIFEERSGIRIDLTPDSPEPKK